jgi:hypothetical protein
MSIVRYYAYQIPGSKPVVESPKLVIRSIEGRTYYWNYSKQTWTRMTKRCPYLT